MNKARTIAEVIMALGLIVFAGVELTEDKAYYCSSRGIALNCDRTTATRCYYENEVGATKYKVCKEGWKPMKDLLETNILSDTQVKVTANGGVFICETNNGFVNSYSRCIKDDGKETYIGEII